MKKFCFIKKIIIKFIILIGTNKNHLKQYEEAITNLNKAIELNSTNCLLYSERALSKHSLGLYEEAIKDYDKAIELDNNNYIAYNNIITEDLRNMV